MKLKTKAGIAEPMPLSDIQEYNHRLNILTKWLKAVVILGWSVFMYVVIMTVYIIWNNVLNNLIASWS